MIEFTIEKWRRFFPFSVVRPEQEQAINFALDAYFNKQKRFVVCELGVGAGKSAVAVAIGNYINEYVSLGAGFTPGAYILTTQKILQEQYLRDFGPGKGLLLSIKSSTNYQCNFFQEQTCAESKRVLSKMSKQLAGSEFAKCCRGTCPYNTDKQAFLDSPLSITNFSYFLAETMYAGKLEPRNALIIDECHNVENELGKFVEVTFSEKFARDVLKCKIPALGTQEEVFNWIKNTYKASVAKYIKGVEKAIQSKFVEGMSDFGEFTKQYEMLDKHICKINRFVNTYTSENWVMNVIKPFEGKRGGRKFEFKPVDVSHYSHDLLFKFGQRVLMMSATIIDKDMFCKTLGIDQDDCEFISIESPFPIENRPVHYLSVGKMSSDAILQTLPNMVEVIKEILKQHGDSKGIIHCVNYKVVNYIRDHLRDPRLLIQNDENRDAILRRHIDADEPTVLVSPSMTEGVDLKDDLSRFQIFCKVPFPYMGDEVVKKRMKRDPGWYPFVTVRSLIQGSGRSIRTETDSATTYILDSCWEAFYRQNKSLFPQSFRKSIIT